ncbi:outer membrane lipoprotein carrier protein LolA [Vibrio sp. ZSDE26]|uniref:Outer membrane lipoprotein carrier protein LolA n=1 Tax=Vibrio amylolyticus TaxID=2847292 RepID=A0A9X1XKZ8_9VIBR|nr:outer membrane lipoprotein carrier protein LolA [Vibrio amylolyticus]MCK6264371.1 outer membrane lipoprotein carrier protein LolA [Vibrio amylolyticus]
MSLFVTSVFVTSVFATSAVAAPSSLVRVNDLDDLQQQLSQHPIVRGDFTQLRHLEMFKQPLSSTGEFTLSKRDGLLWQQHQPFPVNLVLTENQLRQTFSDQPPQVITAKENPMAFYFSHIFLSVFHGDTEALKAQFELDFSSSDSQWTLHLTPTQAPLNAVFEQIVLQGTQDIDALTLIEVRGDKTEILFTNQNHQPEYLTDVEQAQFEF